MDRDLIVVTTDEMIVGRMRAVAEASGGVCSVLPGIEASESLDEPLAIVLDLGIASAVEAAQTLRERWPHTLIAGFVSLPDPVRWRAALEAGYNLVATRGTIATQLRQALTTWSGPPSADRFRLFDAADVVGRLGVVARLSDTPVGSIAVYQIARELFAAGDICPHAGARISEGEITGGIVTCPRHGSRFDVTTGERVRGPADDPIPIYRVVVDQGVAYLEY